jgi:hypothetical protein
VISDELVEAGARHLARNRHDAVAHQWHRNITATVVDAVEPIILAAELTALREQVADLPHAPACQADALCWCPIADVLELVDDRLLMLDQGEL